MFVILITWYQERKTENALFALKELWTPLSKVFRDGKVQQIKSTNLVRGDLLLFDEGDQIAADGVIRISKNLLFNESLLTGESVPVEKEAHLHHENQGISEKNMAFSGTFVVRGQGVAEIIHTGEFTSLGKIGKSLLEHPPESTPLQLEIKRTIRNIAIIGGVFCLSILLLHLITHQGFAKGLLASLSIAMAVLPEEMPMILTIFLAMGAFRMSKANVLTRRMYTIETLGAATLLCVDKTGTLTLNKMSLAWVYSTQKDLNMTRTIDKLEDDFSEVIYTACLASQQKPFDPMEIALLEQMDKLSPKSRLFDPLNNICIKEYPISKEHLAVTNLWKNLSDADGLLAASKGAPETILSICRLSPDEKKLSSAELNSWHNKDFGSWRSQKLI